MRIRNSRLVRKGIALGMRMPRLIRRAIAAETDYRAQPPVLVNSFPKSGTHLLLQVARSFPNTRYYGSFIASMPSVSFRERSPRAHVRLIRGIPPGEVLPGHLFFEEEYERALRELNCIHYFIYRDLRDVVVSEAYYLTHMNPWHRMHRYFARLDSVDARISAAILGMPKTECPYDYPDIGVRFDRYRGWVGRDDVLTVRFEELVSNGREESVRRVAAFYLHRLNRLDDLEHVHRAALGAVRPSESHTFREGRVGAWREVFTDRHRHEMKAVAGDLLIQLGYETTLSW